MRRTPLRRITAAATTTAIVTALLTLGAGAAQADLHSCKRLQKGNTGSMWCSGTDRYQAVGGCKPFFGPEVRRYGRVVDPGVASTIRCGKGETLKWFSVLTV